MATAASNVINDELKRDLDKLAKAGRILDLMGHSDRIFGHVSMRDPDGRGFWMKRHKISIGELWDHRDFVLVAFDGKKIHGDGDRHSEWPIHGKIYERRPDVNSVGHTHPFYGCIYSGVDEPLRQITGGGPPPPRFTAMSGLIVKPEQGEMLAETLGKADRMFMRNHGVVFCGDSIEAMTCAGIALEDSCRQVLTAKASGFDCKPIPPEESYGRLDVGTNFGTPAGLFNYYARVLERTEALGAPSLSAKPVPIARR
jgi:ribulose-5-phosphate 4-epimerase/fuculose-1-phosphate aldolase